MEIYTERNKEWFSDFALLFKELLTDDGSIVIEIGNSWEANRPVQSLLHLESLLAFVKKAELNLNKNLFATTPRDFSRKMGNSKRIRAVDS